MCAKDKKMYQNTFFLEEKQYNCKKQIWSNIFDNEYLTKQMNDYTNESINKVLKSQWFL
jgi:hypothetical protein